MLVHWDTLEFVFLGGAQYYQFHISLFTPQWVSVGTRRERTVHLTTGTVNSYYEVQAVWASLHTLEDSNSHPGGSL